MHTCLKRPWIHGSQCWVYCSQAYQCWSLVCAWTEHDATSRVRRIVCAFDNFSVVMSAMKWSRAEWADGDERHDMSIPGYRKPMSTAQAKSMQSKELSPVITADMIGIDWLDNDCWLKIFNHFSLVDCFRLAIVDTRYENLVFDLLVSSRRWSLMP